MNTLYVIGYILLVISFFYSLVEAWNTHKFVPFFFKYGLVVKNLDIDIRPLQQDSGQALFFSDCVFKIVSKNECRFHTKFFRGFVTPFPLKGVLVWNNEIAKAIVLLPVGSSCFFGVMLLAGIPYLINSIASLDFLSAVFSLLFILAISSIVFGSILFEIKVVTKALTELQKYSVHY